MSISSDQVLHTLERFLQVTPPGSSTAAEVSAALHAPGFHAAVAGLLTGESVSPQAVSAFQVWLSQALGGDCWKASALAEIVLAVIQIERSSLGTTRSRQLRRQTDPRLVQVVCDDWLTPSRLDRRFQKSGIYVQFSQAAGQEHDQQALSRDPQGIDGEGETAAKTLVADNPWRAKHELEGQRRAVSENVEEYRRYARRHSPEKDSALRTIKIAQRCQRPSACRRWWPGKSPRSSVTAG